jgi:hypothetical protein
MHGTTVKVSQKIFWGGERKRKEKEKIKKERKKERKR